MTFFHPYAIIKVQQISIGTWHVTLQFNKEAHMKIQLSVIKPDRRKFSKCKTMTLLFYFENSYFS